MVKLFAQGHNVNKNDSCARSRTKAPRLRPRLFSLWHSYSTARLVPSDTNTGALLVTWRAAMPWHWSITQTLATQCFTAC